VGNDSADLVARLVADDETALEEAYRLYAARCNAIAYRVLHDDDAARDAVQESFLALWSHRHGLVVRTAGLAPWLFVVARNAAIGMLRRTSARTAREERSQADRPNASAPNPADQVATAADTRQLRQALATLPPEQRTAVELAYFKFLTMAQIAQQTGSPLGTVKRRIQLAVRQLGRVMSEQRS
jgi:RNA polymerase sigma-70 factor (ECF subfamily)